MSEANLMKSSENMTTHKEALKLALEALENLIPIGERTATLQTKAITAIKEALAQPEQEPCRHRIADIRNEAVKSGYMCMDCGALFGAYTTPPQRKPLTDEQIDAIADKFTVHTGEMWEPELCIEFNDSCKSVHSFARAIEAAHGIKE